MITISPSILACDFANIESELKKIEDAKDIWIHLDIMDGHFVPNLTFGIPVVKRIGQVTNHTLDAHLMVSNPEFHIERMSDLGVTNITFHHEAVVDSMKLIKKAKQLYKSVGLSIKPKTEATDLSDEILSEIDVVLVMSVEPGFGGQSFMPNALDKISILKERRTKLGAEFIIQVDGGINKTTYKDVIDAGADNLVAGSYVFSEPNQDYISRIESLRN